MTDTGNDDPDDAVWEEALKLVGMVLNELHYAMLLNAIWWRCSTQPDILNEMRGTKKGVAFDAIRDVVHMSLVQCLMRMHDRDPRTASLDRLLRHVDESGLRDKLNGASWSSRLDIPNALLKARSIYDSDQYQALLKGLRALRDQMIAHLDKAPNEHGVKYGHEAELLRMTAQVFQYVQLALTGGTDDFESASNQYADCSDEFWTHAARPAANHDTGAQ